MKDVLIEICCGSVQDVKSAQNGGAKRVELNSSLALGGLTPSLATLQLAKRYTNIPIMSMVRPRQGGFCYTDLEYETAFLDAEKLLLHGSDGLVFGFLTEDGQLDKNRCKQFIDLCNGKQAVFHRAIDVVADWKETLDSLIELGFSRVLTSGQAPNALYGASVIKEMVDFVDGAIEILPGGGVNLQTVDRIIRETGVNQIHFSGSKKKYDNSTLNNPQIAFGATLQMPENCFSVTDEAYVDKMKNHLLKGEA